MSNKEYDDNNELSLRNEALEARLESAEQKAEIAQMRYELQKVQAEKASKLEDSLFSPQLMEHYMNVATVLSKSNIVPKNYIGKPNDIFVAMEMGYQLGFSVAQSLQDIAVINGKPSLYGDGLLALAYNHADRESIKEEPFFNGDQVVGYRCTIKRKSEVDAHVGTFSIDDAKKAGLWGKSGPWSQYPARMLQMRARSFAIRDAFPDALRGLKSAEEMQDIPIEGESKRVHEGNTQTAKLNNLLSSRAPDKEPVTVEEKPTAPVEASSCDRDVPVTKYMIAEIEVLMNAKKMSDERKRKAMAYFNINSLDELTMAQADVFLVQLSKI